MKQNSLKAQSSSKRLLRFGGGPADQGGLTLPSIDGGDSSSKKSRGHHGGGSDTNMSNFSKMSGKVRKMQTIEEVGPYGKTPVLGQIAMEKRW